jgi:hypothetical protein
LILDQPKLLEFVHEDVHARARGSDHVCEGLLRDPRQRRLWIGLAGPNAGKGRPKGSLNQATADVRAIAQSYTEEAILTLVALMRRKKTPPQTRAYAASAILDRGHGRPGHLKRNTGESGTGPVTVNITEEFYPNGCRVPRWRSGRVT